MTNSDTGHGRKLRRARNVVKRFERDQFTAIDFRVSQKTRVERYNRAKALLLAEKLKAS